MQETSLSTKWRKQPGGGDKVYSAGMFSAGTGMLAFQVASPELTVGGLPSWAIAIPLALGLYFAVYRRSTRAQFRSQ